MSHEIAHLLGVRHDGESPDALACNTREGHIMESEFIPERVDKLLEENLWSSCSIEQLIFHSAGSLWSCLSNTPPSFVKYKTKDVSSVFYFLQRKWQMCKYLLWENKK